MHLLCRPLDIAIAQQGHQVVGDRTHHRILEINHRQAALVLRHEIAAVKIPVHQHPGLLQGAADQFLEKLVQYKPLFLAQGATQQASTNQ